MKTREGYYSEHVRDEALQSILDDLNQRQKSVYHIIEKWQPVSNERIAEHLNLYPHQVTPRVLELREMGVVEFAGEGISNKSSRKVSLWKIKPQPDQLSLFN